MNDDLQYQDYLSKGGSLTYEEYLSANMLFSSIEDADEDLKKKDQPIENGAQNLTTSTPTPQTEMPTLPNPIPENEFTVPMGSEQDLMSASSDTTVQTPSMGLPLTDVVSSGTENLPTNIQPISGITNPTLDNAGNIPIPTNPIQNPMVKNMGSQLNLNNRNLANIDAFYNATEKNQQQTEVKSV